MTSAQAGNSRLATAKAGRKDEFYTQLSDIEKELRHYRRHFKGKVVYCNCDDPRASNFFHYFSYNFEKLGLKTVRDLAEWKFVAWAQAIVTLAKTEE